MLIGLSATNTIIARKYVCDKRNKCDIKNACVTYEILTENIYSVRRKKHVYVEYPPAFWNS